MIAGKQQRVWSTVHASQSGYLQPELHIIEGPPCSTSLGGSQNPQEVGVPPRHPLNAEWPSTDWSRRAGPYYTGGSSPLPFP